MIKQNVEFEVLVNGNPIREFWHGGKDYIEGRKGQEYSLRIRNNGFTRILVVPSVDGLSVMNGEKASYKSGGYIINGNDSLVIDGWRTSLKEVSKFFFSDKEKSYANKTEKGGNEGVIGLAVFNEKDRIVERILDIRKFKKIEEDIRPPYQPPYKPWQDPQRVPYSFEDVPMQERMMQASCMFNCCSLKADLGTGFGDTKVSEVREVEFEKDTVNPVIEFAIYYASRKALEDMGIDFGKKPTYVYPDAFPGRFCRPPEN